MAGDKERISDKNFLAGVRAGRKPKQLPPKSGLYHSVIDCGNIAGPTGRIKYQKAPNETVLSNNGAWIVLGSDRPNSFRSGYGAFGGCKAASIDIVVGRLATARKGKGPKQAKGQFAFVNPDFSADAARIHISQMTNIDHNFGIAEGNAPQSRARSGIGIKADAVRVIGRESVKIVTGGMQDVKHQAGGEPTSLGRKIQQPAPTIEFIAGNKINDKVVWGGLFNPKERIRGLQGIALGGNVRDGMGELCDAVMQINAATMAIGSIAEKMYVALGITSPLLLGGISAISVLESALRGKMSLYHLRAELVTWKVNYLTAAGYKCIWSRNVKST